jgi:mannose-6-phosphate isomerase-like protein (cupin superfamily)
MSYNRYVFDTNHTTPYHFPHSTNLLILDRAEAETSEAFLVRLQPDDKPPLHLHEETEQVIYILRGAGTLQIGQGQPEFYPVKPADLVRIPPRTWHVIHSDGQAELLYLCVSCFLGGRPEAEPTWDSHVRYLCRESGLEFDNVYGGS